MTLLACPLRCVDWFECVEVFCVPQAYVSWPCIHRYHQRHERPV